VDRSRYAIIKVPVPANAKEKGKLSPVLSGLEKAISVLQLEQALNLPSNQHYDKPPSGWAPR